MNNQKQLWDILHEKGKVDHFSDKPTKFAEEVQSLITPGSKILEFGCGVGNDSAFFAKQGHDVLAIDFSEVAIKNNRKRFKADNLQFEVLDMGKPLQFADKTFDVVYARLSLHYFNDKVTRQIFKEIHRILKPEGLLCFICKSTDDPLYGQGKHIGKDMFEEGGHIRHLFSKEYVQACLKGMFNIRNIETGQEDFYNIPSAFIKLIVTQITHAGHG